MSCRVHACLYVYVSAAYRHKHLFGLCHRMELERLEYFSASYKTETVGSFPISLYGCAGTCREHAREMLKKQEVLLQHLNNLVVSHDVRRIVADYALPSSKHLFFLYHAFHCLTERCKVGVLASELVVEYSACWCRAISPKKPIGFDLPVQFRIPRTGSLLDRMWLLPPDTIRSEPHNKRAQCRKLQRPKTLANLKT